MAYSPDRYSDEKRDYFDESSSNGGHWADNGGGVASPGSAGSYAQRQRPGLTVEIAPPRAAFIAEPSRSGAASPSSVNFGDYSASGANGKTRLRPECNINWSRFSMAMHREKETRGQKKEKTWLDKKTSSSKKWIVMGYMAAVLVLALIGGLVAWHFIRPRTTTTPEIASLGGLDGNSASASSSSASSSSATGTRVAAVADVTSGSSTSSTASSIASSTAPTAASAAATTAKAATSAKVVSTSAATSVASSKSKAVTSTAARRHRRNYGGHGQ